MLTLGDTTGECFSLLRMAVCIVQVVRCNDAFEQGCAWGGGSSNPISWWSGVGKWWWYYFFFHLSLGVKLHNEPTPVAKVTFVHWRRVVSCLKSFREIFSSAGFHSTEVQMMKINCKQRFSWLLPPLLGRVCVWHSFLGERLHGRGRWRESGEEDVPRGVYRLLWLTTTSSVHVWCALAPPALLRALALLDTHVCPGQEAPTPGRQICLYTEAW